MRIAILGVGSLGGVLLGSLSDTESELICVSRGETAARLSSGLTLYTPEGTIEMVPGERYLVIDSESGPVPEQVLGTCDAAVIAGKADSTETLSSLARDLLKPEGVAVSIQNGLGHDGVISRRVGGNRALGGSTTHSAWREGDGSVHWTGRGSIYLGKLDGSYPCKTSSDLIRALDEADLEARWTDDIRSQIWRKLLINVAINPVCAIAGVRNGALAEVPELWTQSLEAMREAEEVAIASGIDLGEVESEDYLKKVVESTADNRVSMLQDLMAGRKTEIEVLCGAVVSRGKDLGIPTPRNEVLVALIRGIEMSRHYD